ncbi:MAG: tetratricopeptide repeat protein [Desulfobaccales bacterium]
MAKITPRRRVALDSPEEMLTLAQRVLGQVKPYAKWLVGGGVVIAVALGAWGINSWVQGNREAKAVAALALVTPKVSLAAPDVAAVQALDRFVQEYAGTRAAREAQLLRANILFRLSRYGEAATAYESLLDGRDPGWDMLITETLSYCYEGMGNFQKAAEVLKPVAEQTSGAMQSEVMRRLALLYDQAKEPKEAAVYWRRLLEKPPEAALKPYFQEKLAAAEAQVKK